MRTPRCSRRPRTGRPPPRGFWQAGDGSDCQTPCRHNLHEALSHEVLGHLVPSAIPADVRRVSPPVASGTLRSRNCRMSSRSSANAMSARCTAAPRTPLNPHTKLLPALGRVTLRAPLVIVVYLARYCSMILGRCTRTTSDCMLARRIVGSARSVSAGCAHGARGAEDDCAPEPRGSRHSATRKHPLHHGREVGDLRRRRVLRVGRFRTPRIRSVAHHHHLQTDSFLVGPTFLNLGAQLRQVLACLLVLTRHCLRQQPYRSGALLPQLCDSRA